jgi:predicted transcriptional regulator
VNNIESLWITARNRGGEHRDRRTPSAGIAAVLGALFEGGSSYGAEIARATGQAQNNVAVSLLKLRRFGLVDVVEELDGYGHQGGGRPAVFWRLTRDGRELAELLAAEQEVAA